MSGEVVSFNRVRATKEGDGKLWTPLDALRAAIKDIENGEFDPDMVYVAFRTKTDSEGFRSYENFFASGGSALEIAGLLAMHQAIQCKPES